MTPTGPVIDQVDLAASVATGIVSGATIPLIQMKELRLLPVIVPVIVPEPELER